jgi:diguanylate cyclase (GGDEF)-like protein
MSDVRSAAERYDRLKKGRDLVRRTSSLLSADLPLQDIFGQLAVLLALFVDASSILIAIGDESDARLEYAFEDGVGGRPDNTQVGPASTTSLVLRTGDPVLRRRPEDWSETTLLTLHGRETWQPISAMFVPILFGGRTIGVLSVQSRQSDAYDNDDLAMLERCAIYLGARFHDEEQRAASASLRQIATTDALTGLPNRRSFDDALLNEWRRCARSESSLALAMIDVDYFKKFNDAYGHVAGDACLRQIAQAIAGCMKRPGDLVARYGGEEFAFIAPESEVAGAVRLAESICQAVREIAIPHEGSSLGYATLSIGVATLVPDAETDPKSLVAAADRKLYEAKKSGRNCVASDGHRSVAPSAEARVILRHNLPHYLTEIVGRERDVVEVVSMLSASRLVSILGPGGIGKTRLAVQVCEQLLDAYGDGVWFVDLSSLDDPMLVPSAIAEVFGIGDESGTRPLIERVGVVLNAKSLLLVLDNCEHVISAAADAAGRLIQFCPQLRILSTSREPLGVAGEQSYRMPTLPVPPEGESQTAQSVMQYAAAQLFVTRAHAAQHTFVLTDESAPIVANIVRRLDGIALAIELAAPRVKALSVALLDARLGERFELLTGGSRSAPARQKTLHALIGWSYDLLTEAERSLLRQCAIFRGGWTLEAAESTSADERFARWVALDLLSSLVDKSLVVVEVTGTEQRYRLLESTRQFALERLTAADELRETAARHGRYFAEVAQRAGEAYWRSDADEWTAPVRRELENHRAAIEWGLGTEGDAEAAAAIVAGLRQLWLWVARREGRMLVARTAAVLPSDARAVVRGRLALAASQLEGGAAQSATPAAEAGRLLGGGADEIGHAEALQREGQALGKAGRLAEALARFDEAQAAARITRTPRLIAAVLSNAAYWLGAAGERARARADLDEATDLLRACDDRRRLALNQVNRAEFLFAEGDVEGALASAREAEAVYRERSAESNLATVLHNATAYLLALGRRDEAWGAAREALEIEFRADNAADAAVTIGNLAQLAAETGDAVRATRLLGYSDAVYAKMGNAREPTEQHGYDCALGLIRTALPDDRIRALLAEGAAMEQDRAVAEALAIPQPRASQSSAAP